MKLRYTLPALVDLAAILDYIAEQSPQAAGRIQARIKAVTDIVARYPRLGTPTDEPGIRRIATTPYPYLVFYEVAGDEIIVHAVRHGARGPSDTPGSE